MTRIERNLQDLASKAYSAACITPSLWDTDFKIANDALHTYQAQRAIKLSKNK